MKVQMYGSEWFSSRAGGLNRYFEELYQALREQSGVAVSAAAFGRAPEGATSWGSVDSRLPLRVLRSAGRPGQKVDVVDNHFSLYGPVRRPAGALVVQHFQGPWAYESQAAGQGKVLVTAKKVLERARYSRADAFIVLSVAFRDLLVSEYGVPPQKVFVLPPGVNAARFSVKKVRPGGVAPVAICVRRLERRMGIDVLIRSWQRVAARRPDAVLRVIGQGSERLSLERLARELGVGDSVQFTGSLSDSELSREYLRADVSVVPSISLEGFGLIALESLASGTPAIVTNCGGLPDAVGGLDRSLIVPAGDVDSLARRIGLAFEGAVPNAASCVAHARTFSWGRTASAHLELYRSLLRERGADVG